MTANSYDRAISPASGNLLNFVALCFHLIPKNALSYLTGTIARLELPDPFRLWMLRTFASTFHLDLDEAAAPLASFRTVEDLFTRALKPGIRPITGPVCSPADGILARSLPATADEAVQAKGLTYSLGELVLGEGHKATKLDLAWYQTVYLAPHNYHRVHSPFAGQVTNLRYIPGELWPVALPFILRVPRVFTRNERLVFDVALDGGGMAYVVMVGAFNVGRMTTPLATSLITNKSPWPRGARPVVWPMVPPRPVAAGEEIGTFQLGSTVVIAYDREAAARFPLLRTEDSKPILMGQSLGGPS